MRAVIDQGEGPVAVLLHGQPGTATVWDAAISPMVDEGFRVLAVNRPGYDGEPDQATGFNGNVAALVAMLDRLDIDRAYLVGHSWGGGVALEAAAHYPDRVSGLLLLGSVGSPYSVSISDRLLARTLLGKLGARAAQTAGSRFAWFVAWSSGGPSDPKTVAEVRAALAEWRRIGAWRAFEIEQQALVREIGDLVADLPLIRCPVIVTQGRRDGYVTPQAGRDLAARLATSTYVEPDAGHGIPAEHPALVGELLGRLRDTVLAQAPPH